MIARQFEPPIETISQPRSRLRQRLNPTQAQRQPSDAVTATATCRVECRWVMGSVNPRYQFRAVIQSLGGQRRIIARSPMFVSCQTPIFPTCDAREALTALRDTLLTNGWRAVVPENGDHWYAMSFQQSTNLRG
jgi:hypothetical protein